MSKELASKEQIESSKLVVDALLEFLSGENQSLPQFVKFLREKLSDPEFKFPSDLPDLLLEGKSFKGSVIPESRNIKMGFQIKDNWKPLPANDSISISDLKVKISIDFATSKILGELAATLEFFGMKVGFNALKFDHNGQSGDYSLSGKSKAKQKFKVGTMDLNVIQVEAEVNHKEATKEDSATTGAIQLDTKFGDTKCNFRSNFPGECVLEGSIPKITLGEITNSFFDEGTISSDLTNLQLENIAVSVKPQNNEFSLTCKSAAEQDLKICNIDFKIKKIDFKLDRKTGDGGKGTTSGHFELGTSIEDSDCKLCAELAEDSSPIKGSIQRITLGAITNGFMENRQLPGGVEKMALENVELELTPQTGDFSLKGDSDSPQDLEIGSSKLIIKRINCSIKRNTEAEGNSKTTGDLQLTTTIGESSCELKANLDEEFILKGSFESIKLQAIIKHFLKDKKLPKLIEMLPIEFEKLDCTAQPKDGEYTLKGNSNKIWGFFEFEIDAKVIFNGNGPPAVNGFIKGPFGLEKSLSE